MKKLFFTLILLLFLTCSKDSTEDNSSVYVAPPTNTTNTITTPTVTQYTLTVTAGTGGSVSTAGGTYNDGANLSITATPEKGYEFVGWEGNESDSPNLSITLNSDTILEANFQRIIFESRSERYSSINETTGYYKKTKYFESYLLPQELDEFAIRNILPLDYYWSYRIYDNDKIIGDFDKNGYNDLFAFATDFIPKGDVNYGAENGKFIYVKDYLYNSEKIILDSNVAYGAGKMEIQDFDNDGIEEIIFWHTNAKLNRYNEQEFVGGAGVDHPILSPTLIHINEEQISYEEIGVMMDSHCGTSGDINNDGFVDFIQFPVNAVASNIVQPPLPFVNLNNGNGTFNTVNLFSSINVSSFEAFGIELFDVDNDGNLDLLYGKDIGDPEVECAAGVIENCNPAIFWGDGSGQFDYNNRLLLDPSFIENNQSQNSILGFAFSDFDNDNDIDIIMSTTRIDGTFQSGVYYDNYYLILYENIGQRNFIDSTNLIEGSFDESYSHFGHFYEIRVIDRDNDGDFDLIPDAIGNLSTKVQNWSPNLYWENIGGSYVRRINNNQQ